MQTPVRVRAVAHAVSAAFPCLVPFSVGKDHGVLYSTCMGYTNKQRLLWLGVSATKVTLFLFFFFSPKWSCSRCNILFYFYSAYHWKLMFRIAGSDILTVHTGKKKSMKYVKVSGYYWAYGKGKSVTWGVLSLHRCALWRTQIIRFVCACRCVTALQRRKQDA